MDFSVVFSLLVLCASTVVAFPPPSSAAAGGAIPTTLEGPFEPVTRSFDRSLRRGSEDLPTDDPRLAKRVPSIFPEQIALAISSSTSIWVSWITDLEPGTKYFYACGDSSLSAMSEEHMFETLPSPSACTYPSIRIAVVGDLGLTNNLTSTIDHLVKNEPSVLLMVGDLCYANQYLTTGGKGASCFSCAFPDAPIRESYQPRWDAWGRFMEPLTSKIPMMVIEGNHEIEPQIDGITFRAYLSRFAVPSLESGSSSNFYYSFDAAGVHFLMLGAYVDYNKTGAQYAWLKQDLLKVDRRVTPWLVAAWHPPWYNSYSSHYQEFECMRLEMEELLYTNGVDIVFSGHVTENDAVDIVEVALKHYSSDITTRAMSLIALLKLSSRLPTCSEC